MSTENGNTGPSSPSGSTESLGQTIEFTGQVPASQAPTDAQQTYEFYMHEVKQNTSPDKGNPSEYDTEGNAGNEAMMDMLATRLGVTRDKDKEK